MNIQIKLTGQTLTAAAPVLAEQSLGKLFCSLEADQEWDGLSIRLIFQLKSSGEPITREVQVDDFSSIPVPEACIRAGRLYITAVGTEGDLVRLTTGHMPCGIPISPVQALSAGPAEKLTISEYERLLDMVGNLSALKTGDKRNLVSAVNWLKTNAGSIESGAEYTDMTEEFSMQNDFPSPLSFLRTMGVGKWTVNDSWVSEPSITRCFMEIWDSGETEWRRERAYNSEDGAFTEALYSGNTKVCSVTSGGGGDPVIQIGTSVVLTGSILPVPGEADQGKILTAGAGGYVLTAVDNAEETPV